MKILLTVASVVILVAHIMARQVDASEGFEDLVKVVKSGANDEVLTAYIDTSPVAFAPTVDEILYLNDLGVSADIIRTVIEHGKEGAAGVSTGSRLVANEEGSPPRPAPALPEPLLQLAVYAPPPGVSVPPAQDVGAEDAAGAGENVQAVQEVVQEPILEAPVVTAPPPDAVDISTFYDALSPYGSWLNVDGTWYWQPTVMVTDSDWTPYCQGGQWVYTDCGWLWQSTYSWGWAPFHYGRWRLDPRFGWIWLPDTTWGPAWVSWRQSDEAIGWAPLPPEARYEAGVGFFFHGGRVSADFSFGLESRQFTFVPVRSFSERELDRLRLPRTEVTRIYNATTALQNNYTYNHRIIDRGPSIARIQKVTHQTVKPLRIVDQQIEAGHPIRSGTISSESVAVYAPHVVSTTHETPQAVIARRQASAQTRQVEARKGSVFGNYQGASVVQSEQERGAISREATRFAKTPGSTVPPATKVQMDEADARRRQIDEAAVARQHQEQQHAEAAAAQQRQAEEAAANLRERERQRAAEVAQKQAEQRQHDQEIERQRSAAEQQHRAAEFAQKQAEQQRAEVYARQQAEQQRAQELARQREEQQRAEVARQREEQLRAQLQAQRQTEEAAARQQQEQRVQQQRQQEQQQQQRQEQQQQQQREQQQAAQQRVQQSAFQGYGNSSMTSAASNRGSASRVGVMNTRKR
jgi:hypothetical protein